MTPSMPWLESPEACSRGWRVSMALVFQLGADIVATTTSPSGQNLIQLGVVAVIRTFLNLFLARGNRSGETAGGPASGS
ncbi:DUF1622 domain-containing protein [Synechococcus sp. CS-1332]|uniref:DUF1622 domain-containing protein n=1 Tax=Synechococcus sp. CS-1332 TaxID=2847972 RepID=UPI00288048BF|nr:DUF1622 domain-containing protein [Synechococcus sp. CS-1332]MCT0207135.1 DUF1622 domain-containing protein [Synechococcus sp. CS-1332]